MSDIVETLYPYQSDQGQGLSFEAGMKISVQERGENGWWKGSLLKNNSEDGQPEAEGWFPASYVDDQIKTSLEEKAEVIPLPPTKSIPSPLPQNWKATKASDGRIYYYNEVTKETTWSFPQDSSPINSPSVSYQKRHTISQCNNIRRTSSPLQIVKDEHLSITDKQQSKSNNNLSSISGSGPHTPPSSSREHPDGRSADGKSVDSSDSGGNRRRKAKQMALELTPSRPSFLNYPSIADSKEQNLLNLQEVTFCDHFWDDLGESTGFDIVKAYVIKGKSNCREMADFFKERAAIEESYARNLERLAQSSYGNQEKGSCGETWQRLKKGVEEEGKSHKSFSTALLQGLHKTLNEYAERPVLQTKKDSKRIVKIDVLIQEDRKHVASKYKEVEKQHAVLLERQAKVNQTNKQHEIAKTQKKIATSVEDLKRSINEYNDAQRKWIDDMILGLLELEKRETERLEFLKMKFDLYTEMATTAYASDTAVTAKTLKEIEKIDPLLDRKAFVEGNRTGSIRPVDRKK